MSRQKHFEGSMIINYEFPISWFASRTLPVLHGNKARRSHDELRDQGRLALCPRLVEMERHHCP